MSLLFSLLIIHKWPKYKTHSGLPDTKRLYSNDINHLIPTTMMSQEKISPPLSPRMNVDMVMTDLYYQENCPCHKISLFQISTLHIIITPLSTPWLYTFTFTPNHESILQPKQPRRNQRPSYWSTVVQYLLRPQLLGSGKRPPPPNQSRPFGLPR